jgi:hypothetical protein
MGIAAAESDHQGEGENAFLAFPAVPKPNRAAEAKDRNSNLSNILPVTTFKTIDLEGKKISGPLFSRFCAESSVFFEVFSAPKCVHENQNRTFVYGYTGRAGRPSS